MLLIIVVILAAGCLGGVVNYLLRTKSDPDALKWWESIVVGTGAAFLVPLFLNMASSDLVEKMRSAQGAPDFSKFLVFAGFCLVAAMSSRAFIKTISDRVLKDVAEAKEKATSAETKADSAEKRSIGAEEKASEVQSRVEPFVESSTEQDSSEASFTALESARVPLSDVEKKVLDTLARDKYVLRTRTGIAKDSGLEKEAVVQCVEDLKARGLVNSTQILKRDGEPRTRWYITPEGRNALA